jgi:hypothetical protein
MLRDRFNFPAGEVFFDSEVKTKLVCMSHGW